MLVNEEFANFRGTDPESIIGKTVHDYHGPELAKELDLQDREVVEADTSVKREIKMIDADGVERDFIIVRFTVSAEDGSLTAIGSISTDITDSKEAEQALKLAQDPAAAGHSGLYWRN